ncbi:hypothetical protein COLO4_15780 [Corchorus olitorius]|uniref:PGG domain-containing protein n=1 Tax=Corchorus olitorius TaxID=93759 RepID=A0A1R3JL74_9ROSI|nr:hypothetical protein COLO4_15780 [Corchorus olitorius]
MDHDHLPLENMTLMDDALYNAVGQGRIEELHKYNGSQLVSLRTPNHNTVLHVYLATDPTQFRFAFKFRSFINTYGLWLNPRTSATGILNSMPKMAAYLQSRSGFTRFTATTFVEQILDKCPSLIVQVNAKGQTPLHIAVKYGRFAIVKVLINRAKAVREDPEDPQGIEGAREMLRKTDHESNTALHVAAGNIGKCKVVQALLKLEDPEFSYAANKNLETPLYIAARGGYYHAVAMILDKFKSKAAHNGPHGRTALHAAAMAGDKRTTTTILEKKGYLTRTTDENGQTPLHYAAHLGSYGVVKLLLEKDPSAAYIADKETEMTPILMAARQGHGKIVSEIMSRCPSCCEMVDKRGWNLLHFVAIRRTPPALNGYIVEAEAIGTNYASIRNLRDEKDALGFTPVEFSIASFGGHYGIMFKRMVMPKTKKEQIVNLFEEVLNGEVAGVPVGRGNEDDNLSSYDLDFENARQAHLVVAGLIATVTFAAAITFPGGYKGDDGPEAQLQGTPILIRKAAFRAFVISNAMATVLSFGAVSLHFESALPSVRSKLSSLKMAAVCTYYALYAAIAGFISGSYVVLQPSLPLAIVVCCIGFSFFCFKGFMNFLSHLPVMIRGMLDSVIVEILIDHAKALRGDVEDPQRIEGVRDMLRQTDYESNTALHIAAGKGKWDSTLHSGQRRISSCSGHDIR